MSSTSKTSIGTITVPLTTRFTPPAWCNSLQYTYQTRFGGISQFIRDASGPGDGRTSSCYPPEFGVFKTGISYGIYSPGICPSGWVGHTVEHTRISPTVSWSICCPGSFTASLHTGRGWSCQSTVTTPTTVFLNEDTAVRVSTPILVADWPILIAWQSSDLNRFTPASAPILTSTSGSSSPFASTIKSTSSPTSSTTSSAASKGGTSHTSSIPSSSTNTGNGSLASSHSGLSTAAKAGIGIGVALGFLMIVGALLLLSMRRMRRSRVQHAKSGQDYQSHDPVQLREVSAHRHFSGMKPNELHHSHIRAELPSDWHGHEM